MKVYLIFSIVSDEEGFRDFKEAWLDEEKAEGRATSLTEEKGVLHIVDEVEVRE